MTEETNATAVAPGEQPLAPEAPALAEGVEATAATPKADAVIAEFEAWIVERLYNSPMTRATDAWNHFAAETEGFKARVKAIF